MRIQTFFLRKKQTWTHSNCRVERNAHSHTERKKHHNTVTKTDSRQYDRNEWMKDQIYAEFLLLLLLLLLLLDLISFLSSTFLCYFSFNLFSLLTKHVINSKNRTISWRWNCWWCCFWLNTQKTNDFENMDKFLNTTNTYLLLNDVLHLKYTYVLIWVWCTIHYRPYSIHTHSDTTPSQHNATTIIILWQKCFLLLSMYLACDGLYSTIHPSMKWKLQIYVSVCM